MHGTRPIEVGSPIVGSAGARIGTIDAVFADYVLVRTAGLLPIDLYIPRPEVRSEDGTPRVEATPAQARERWHRPLKRAPHD